MDEPYPQQHDRLLEALDMLVAAGDANVEAWSALKERVEAIRGQRQRGVMYSQMTLPEGLPVIEAVTANQERLAVAAAHVRRTIARELQTEGWSASAIARTFGVTRQRVAELLKPNEH